MLVNKRGLEAKETIGEMQKTINDLNDEVEEKRNE